MDADHPTATPSGVFEHDLQTDVWTWSDEVFRLHGYEPGSVRPTTDLLLAHKHPEALERSRTLVRQVRADGRRFSYYHRVIGADRRERLVLSLGEGVREQVGARVALTRVRGFMIDLSHPVRAGQDAAVRGSTAARATIEQAKGVLMATYSLDPDGAFAFLRRWSMDHNVKVAELAEAVVASAGRGPERLHSGLLSLVDSL